MEWILLLQAVLLGIVEGLTEFLPVSSTGHLIIAGDLLDFTGNRAKTFEIFIQLGSILGVVWYYRHKVFAVARGLNERPARRFVLNLVIAFLPAAFVGVLAHGFIKQHLFNPVTVAGALIAGGFLILLIEQLPLKQRIKSIDTLKPLDALKVGIGQTFALFPGVSRAGATIMGGLLAGLSRTTATEFSFFLAMPTMFAATLYDLYKNLHVLQPGDVTLFALGFLTAFVTAVIVVKLFLAFVARHNFAAFAYYRIGFGCLVLLYFW